MKTIILMLLIAISFDAYGTNTVVISEVNQAGDLIWTSTNTQGYYDVEWASTLDGEWKSSWNSLLGISATAGTVTSRIPLYYRVIWRNISRCQITNETVGAGNGFSTAFAGFLNENSIQPGSITIYTGFGYTFIDEDNNGNLDGSPQGSGTINYATGQFSIDFSGFVPPAGESFRSAYRYEGICD